MSRRPRHQRTWRRPQQGWCWPWQLKAYYADDNVEQRLALLQRVWIGSRNVAALSDALQIISEAGITCQWVTTAAREMLSTPSELAQWSKQHRRDLMDRVRQERFDEGRDQEYGLGLSRIEAADYVVEALQATPAATTRAAMLKLVSTMKRNEARAFGRYYVGAGSAQWQAEHFPWHSTPAHQALVWKWRHRAAARGNARMRDAEGADLRYVRQLVARGDARAQQTLNFYNEIKSRDRSTP